MIEQGGFVFWVLVGMGGVAFVLFIKRFVELRRARIDYDDFIEGVTNVLERGNDDEALANCADVAAPVASVVAAAIRNRAASPHVLRDAVDAQGRAEVGRLNRRLATIAIIGQVAPLVGLFGTLLGFVRAIRLANGAVLVARADLFDAALPCVVLAAVGVLVAAICVVLYGALRVRLDRLVVELEAAASRIVGYLSTLHERELAQ